MSEQDSKIKRGMAWVGLASSLVGVLDIVAHVLILTLWISQEDYGVAVLAFSLFPVLDIATDLGLAAAAIQRDDLDRTKLSTVFWVNIAMSLLLLAVLALVVGPGLAWLHDAPVLAGLFTLYGVKLIGQNLYFLPTSLMKRELRFKELSVIRILANVGEFAGKVGFAAMGFGVWCFVVGPILRVLVTGIGVQLRHPWRPSLEFDVRQGWHWITFGLKVSAHKLMFRLYNVIDYQVVGHYFGQADLAIYEIAFRIVLEPALVISEITINVAFPIFARLKHDAQKLYEQLVAFCRMNLIIMMLFLGVAFVAAEELLAIFSLAKDKDFSTGAPVVRVLCAVALMRALSFVIPPFLDGVGRPAVTLLYTTIAAAVLSVSFISFAHYLGEQLGFVSVALAWLVAYPIAFLALVKMAMAILGMPMHRLFSRLVAITACGVTATALAGATKWTFIELPAVIRLALVVVVMIGSFSLLLSRFQGISIRTVTKSLKG